MTPYFYCPIVNGITTLHSEWSIFTVRASQAEQTRNFNGFKKFRIISSTE
jgi:hypothetical protein